MNRYLDISVCICINTYIYIYRERERDWVRERLSKRERETEREICMPLYVYISLWKDLYQANSIYTCIWVYAGVFYKGISCVYVSFYEVSVNNVHESLHFMFTSKNLE